MREAVFVTDDVDRLQSQLKALRCSECKTDVTLVMGLLIDGAVEEAKITGRMAKRSEPCPHCGVRWTLEVEPPAASE